MSQQDTMEKIRALQGMDEFKEFCEKLVRMAENMKTLRIRQAPLPSLIFAADPGCGVTLHIRLLTELLKELKLLSFMGEEECFEWALSNDPKSAQRLILRIRRAAGFYSQFRGVVGVDLSAQLREDALLFPDRLMELVESRQGQVLFVFILPLKGTEKMQKQLLGRFASFTPVELIHMPFPADEAQYYITDQLFGQGFEVTPAAQQALKRIEKTLSASPSFEGYQTLQNVAHEIVWRKLGQALPPDAKITTKDVQFILGERNFATTLNARGVRPVRRRMGFGEEDKQS